MTLQRPEFQWEKTRQQNPFVEARKFLGLSQQEIANGLDVSEQYVYRLENGLVNSVGPLIREWYARELTEHEIHFSAMDIETQFNAWVRQMRNHVKSAVGNRDDSLLLGPRADVNHLRDENPFLTFMYNVTEYCARKFGLLYDNEGFDTRSQQLFARMLCVHPRSIQLYLAPNISADITPSLRVALKEAGFSEQTLTNLKREVALYKVRTYGK